MKWLLGFFEKFFPNLFKGLSKFIVGFLAPLIGPFIQMLASFFRKVGLFFLIFAAITLAVVAFAAVIEGLIVNLVGLTAPRWLDVGRMLLPSNLSYCLGLLIVARLKSLVFMWVTRFSEKFLHT
jgi:hypothetical protein